MPSCFMRFLPSAYSSQHRGRDGDKVFIVVRDEHCLTHAQKQLGKVPSSAVVNFHCGIVAW